MPMASHKKKVTFAVNESSGAARSKSRSPSSPSSPHSLVPDRSGSASVGHSPRSNNAPGSRPSCSSQPHEVHCICLSDKDAGHMIECEGCLRWSHSKCVSISATLAKSYPFICPFCTRALFQEVASLRSEVSQLREQLAKCSVVPQSCQDQPVLDSLQQLSPGLHTPSSPNSPRVPSDSVNSSASSHSEHLHSNRNRNSSRNRVESSADRRYNIVVLGVAESPSGTSYLGRLNADNDAVSATLSALASSIEHPPFLIRDCRRLGRYRPDSPKPRPLLVTMNSTVEVSTVLSNCRKLSASISIRPDLTLSERQERGILLRERRRLIDAGVSRVDIKLKRSELYVSGTLTGRVVNSVFTANQSLGDLAPQLCHLFSNADSANSSVDASLPPSLPPSPSSSLSTPDPPAS